MPVSTSDKIAALTRDFRSQRRLVSSLMRVYSPRAAEDWLLGVSRHLGARRPVDLIRAGSVRELLDAIELEAAGSFA
jgi:hypothetical protein